MFAVIRHYHFEPKNSSEIDRQVREGFVPLIKKAKGSSAITGSTTETAKPHRSASSRTKPAPTNQSTSPRSSCAITWRS
jgi:hypothetical protein